MSNSLSLLLPTAAHCCIVLAILHIVIYDKFVLYFECHVGNLFSIAYAATTSCSRYCYLILYSGYMPEASHFSSGNCGKYSSTQVLCVLNMFAHSSLSCCSSTRIWTWSEMLAAAGTISRVCVHVLVLCDNLCSLRR